MLLGSRDREEFIILLLLENLSTRNSDFNEFLCKNYDTNEINRRYKELLDNFLNDYALNNSEKSD